MAEYVEGIQVKQAGQVITGQVNPQVAAMFSHIKAELGESALWDFWITAKRYCGFEIQIVQVP